jgi:hypothetical protein
MKTVQFSAKFTSLTANRVNNYEANNILVGSLSQVIASDDYAGFRFYKTNNSGRLCLQMFTTDERLVTIYLSKSLTKEYDNKPFGVRDILTLNVMESYYTNKNGAEDVVLTLHRKAGKLTANDFEAFDKDVLELVNELANA